MLVINEDNSHFFSSRQSAKINLAGLHAGVDQYAGSAAAHRFLGPNAMRASFRRRTSDAIWDPIGDKEPEQRWPFTGYNQGSHRPAPHWWRHDVDCQIPLSAGSIAAW